MVVSRRRWLRVFLWPAWTAGLLAGCGFQPVYRSTVSGSAGAAERELAGIFVDVISDRPGQLLRQALQDRFQVGQDGTPSAYALKVDYSIAGQSIGIQSDNSVTRNRLIARAAYKLRSQNDNGVLITSGTARSVDAVNVIENQLFAADLGNEAADERLATAVADQIALQLGVFFRKRARAASAG